jgi:hypothetical protein
LSGEELNESLLALFAVNLGRSLALSAIAIK